MVPVENPLQGGYIYNYRDGCGSDVLMSRLIEGYDCCNASDYKANNYCLGSMSSPSDHHNVLEAKLMAEEEARTTSSLNDAAASSSKDVDTQEERLDNEGWLQLGIGGSNDKKYDPERILYASDSNIKLSREPMINLVASEGRGSDGGLVELDLLSSPGNGDSEQPGRQPLAPVFHEFNTEHFRAHPRQLLTTPNFSLPLNFFQHPGSSTSSSFVTSSNQETQWTFRPSFIPVNITGSPPPSVAYNLMPFVGSYFTQPVMAGVHEGGSSSDDIRVVSAPRRSHSGIWFILQASQDQAREPLLPQIPKSFLRIKDGRMTVRLLMKYLVNKLSLDSESEIEIRCRGQQLQPCLTLQYVRDNIWIQRDGFPLLSPPGLDRSLPSPSSSTASTDHLMVLNYGPTTAS